MAFFFLPLASIVVIIPGLYGHISDRQCWTDWAGYIKVHGLRRAYESGTDYPPLYLYALWALAKVSPSISDLGANIPYLRLLTLAFDLGGLWVVSRWVGRKDWFAAVSIISLVNVGFSFNTVIWGQVDAILSALVFASLYTAWRTKLLLGAALFALALTFKVQAVLFLPIWGLLMLHAGGARRRWLSLGLAGIVLVALAGVISALFLLTPGSRTALQEAVLDQ